MRGPQAPRMWTTRIPLPIHRSKTRLSVTGATTFKLFPQAYASNNDLLGEWYVGVGWRLPPDELALAKHTFLEFFVLSLLATHTYRPIHWELAHSYRPFCAHLDNRLCTLKQIFPFYACNFWPGSVVAWRNIFM